MIGKRQRIKKKKMNEWIHFKDKWFFLKFSYGTVALLFTDTFINLMIASDILTWKNKLTKIHANIKLRT